MPDPALRPAQRPMLALAIRLLAMVLLSAMLMMVKLAASRGASLPEILFLRQAVSIPLIGGWLAATRGLGRLRTRRLGSHAYRAAIGLTGMVLNFAAVTLLPLAEATTLGFTAPLFAVILAAVLLREGVGVVRWTAVALGLGGVLVIAGPDRGNLSGLGTAIGIAAAFMVALITIQVRDLGRTEEPVTVVFWLAALTTPALALLLPFFTAPHDAVTWLLLLGIGVLGTAGQLLLTAALRLGAVSTVIVMDYSSLAWATLWGWTVFHQLPPPNTWLGAPLIVAAGLVVVWREHRLARDKALDPAVS